MFPPKKVTNQMKAARAVAKAGQPPMPPALAGKTMQTIPLPTSGMSAMAGSPVGPQPAKYSTGGFVNSAGSAKHYGKC
jgi:hypothetical protein